MQEGATIPPPPPLSFSFLYHVWVLCVFIAKLHESFYDKEEKVRQEAVTSVCEAAAEKYDIISQTVGSTHTYINIWLGVGGAWRGGSLCIQATAKNVYFFSKKTFFSPQLRDDLKERMRDKVVRCSYMYHKVVFVFFNHYVSCLAVEYS